jgi:hypothetical protein
MLRIEWQGCPKELVKGLRDIAAWRTREFGDGRGARAVRFVQGAVGDGKRPGFALSHDGDVSTIRYTRVCDAFRGLGNLLGQVAGRGKLRNVEQVCQFDFMGVQFDCARNGVPTVATIQRMMQHAALLGFNGFCLYMEDNYEIPGEPFFGYSRGRFSQRELKALDDYGAALGLEVFGHTQMLGHVEQILHWPAYADLKDVGAVFLADHEPTRKLIEKMLDAISKPFRSKRVFPGVDEAHGLGTGRYRRLKGNKRSFDIFTGHLKFLVDLCKDRGLRPGSSSDMYFRLGSKDNWYYDENAVIPQEVIDAIPPEIQLVYWDYYHTEVSFYERWIDKHRALGKEPIVVGGIWTWNHFWAQLPFSIAASEGLIRGCRSKGIRETICALWGDDGMQVDPYSALVGLAWYAELSYTADVDRGAIRSQVRGACGEDVFESFLRASDIDLLTTAKHMREIPDNPSTYLLWDDPLLGLMGPQNSNRKLAASHAALAKELAGVVGKGELSSRLNFPAQIARVLALKVGLHEKAAAAVKKGDRRAVAALLKSHVQPLRREVDKLWKIHRDMWLATYRPFGLEVIEQRYGGLRARLETMADRLADFVAGRIDSLPEFEQKLQRIYDEDIYSMIYYRQASTASIER